MADPANVGWAKSQLRARASAPFTNTTGTGEAAAIPFTAAKAIRSPVKEPGPWFTHHSAISKGFNRSGANSAFKQPKSSSECFMAPLMATSSMSTGDPSGGALEVPGSARNKLTEPGFADKSILTIQVMALNKPIPQKRKARSVNALTCLPIHGTCGSCYNDCMQWKGFAATALGSREMNQDAFLINDSRGLYAVADGVGGGARGEVASKMAVDGLEQKHPDDGTRLSRTIEALQEAVLKEAMDSLGDALMGTTLTAIHIIGHCAELCHVGDSRLYVYSDNLLRQMTEDHETYDETFQGPVLSSYLGLPPEYYPLRVQEEMIPIKAGDRLLLCSDGLYKQISERRVQDLIQAHLTDGQTLANTLIEEAGRAEHSDNITVVYVQIDP
jgi:serine/threonine protein phosphatase PrpC